MRPQHAALQRNALWATDMPGAHPTILLPTALPLQAETLKWLYAELGVQEGDRMQFRAAGWRLDGSQHLMVCDVLRVTAEALATALAAAAAAAAGAAVKLEPGTALPKQGDGNAPSRSRQLPQPSAANEIVDLTGDRGSLQGCLRVPACVAMCLNASRSAGSSL